ncbi:MAG: hypothetical protein CM1200mP40_31990 [Gammaproteobacteria bacterium]|nr:MAG: hypothetical protein CM1200mP40_31990 [Gammaproteobacteria bacterium]
MTLVKGNTGWIIFDVLLTEQTANAALALANERLGELPVRAVVYSHSHVDHFGGVRGVVSEERLLQVRLRSLLLLALWQKQFQKTSMPGMPCPGEQVCSMDATSPQAIWSG